MVSQRIGWSVVITMSLPTVSTPSRPETVSEALPSRGMMVCSTDGSMVGFAVKSATAHQLCCSLAQFRVGRGHGGALRRLSRACNGGLPTGTGCSMPVPRPKAALTLSLIQFSKKPM